MFKEAVSPSSAIACLGGRAEDPAGYAKIEDSGAENPAGYAKVEEAGAEAA